MILRKLCLVAAFVLVAAATRTATAGNNCPPPRHYSGVCAQVIVWAQDPATGMCCQYGTPCSAPEGWTIYYGPGCTNGGIEL